MTDLLDENAQDLLENVFPQSCLDLSQSLSDILISEQATLNEIHNESNASNPTKDPTSELRARTLRYLQNMTAQCSTLKLWISLKTPKMEGGNNFGVAIQLGVVAEIGKVITFCNNVSSQVSSHAVTRASLARKLEKYPFVDDYRVAIQENDELEFFYLKEIVCTMRNYYLLLADVIAKNYGKLLKPKSTATFDLY